jgi:hypothetical protein
MGSEGRRLRKLNHAPHPHDDPAPPLIAPGYRFHCGSSSSAVGELSFDELVRPALRSLCSLR